MVEPEVESTRAEFPDATVAYDGPDEPVSVVADDRLQLVVGELLENAGEHGATRIEVAVEANGSEASVSVSDDGSGLPDTQRELLTSGEFPEYDDPSAGFGLQIVRLLVLQYGGDITVGEGIDGGTTVTVTLPRVATESELGRSVNVTMSNLYWASVAGLVAGVAMGGFFSLTTDLLPIIGALYGVENPTIGWITHLFHSVIFAIVFAAGLSHPAVGSYVNGPLEGGVAGVAWGAVLWFAGAGIIMPLWLRAVGVMAVFPNLPRLGLVSHLIWGSVLGVAYVALERRDIGYFED
ncbi:MAG: sensor histidine kinase, partial [Halobacteriaceae archaeon]